MLVRKNVARPPVLGAMLATVVALAVAHPGEAVRGWRDGFGKRMRGHVRDGMLGRARHFECFNIVKMAQRYAKDGKAGEQLNEPLVRHCERLKLYAHERHNVCVALVPSRIPEIVEYLEKKPNAPVRDVCDRLGFAPPVSERRTMQRSQCLDVVNATLNVWAREKAESADQDRKLLSKIGRDLCTQDDPLDMARCYNIVRLAKYELLHNRGKWSTAEELCDDLHARHRLFWAGEGASSGTIRGE